MLKSQKMKQPVFLLSALFCFAVFSQFTAAATVCTPDSVSGCKVCKVDGSAWVDEDSNCADGQCFNGKCFTQEDILEQDKARMDAVKEFADNVLKNGRDRYRSSPTPLFANGINTFTGEHVRWHLNTAWPSDPGAKDPVISDLASQQTLFRTLTGLSNLTGNASYKNAAKASIKYHFNNLTDSGGLLQMGGHRFINLETLKISGPGDKAQSHELKNNILYYDLLYEVNSTRTSNYVKAFWNAHIKDWSTFDFNRHGSYGLPASDAWAHTRVNNLAPMRISVSNSLSFINAGTDAIDSASSLYLLTHDKRTLNWSMYFANQYFQARNKTTGLGVYQFTRLRDDRAYLQFGPEFGATALDGNVIIRGNNLYVINAIMQIRIAKELGTEGKDLLEWTRKGLVSFARYAYIPETNKFKPILADGTDLSNYSLKRDGYYGSKGTVLTQYSASSPFLLSYVQGSLATGDKKLWNTSRSIAEGIGLGDIGTDPGKNVSLNLGISSADAYALFALLDLYRNTSNPEYLKMSRVIGNNIRTRHYNRGYFTPGKEYVNANFDTIDPLALLALQTVISGKAYDPSIYTFGEPSISGSYRYPDGTVEPTLWDSYFYQIKRNCTDNCPQNGTRQCNSTGYQICGNVNGDYCLEWTNVTACKSGQTCLNGTCLIPPTIFSCAINVSEVYRGGSILLSQNVSSGTNQISRAWFELNRSINYTSTGNTGNIFWKTLDTSDLLGNYSVRCWVNDSRNNRVYMDGMSLRIVTTTTTTTTTNSTTTTSSPTTSTSSTSTTTTTIAQCIMPGNYPPCEEVTLSEVVNSINRWVEGVYYLGDLIGLINSWADPLSYPPT
jgi:pectate lyase